MSVRWIEEVALDQTISDLVGEVVPTRSGLQEGRDFREDDLVTTFGLELCVQDLGEVAPADPLTALKSLREVVESILLEKMVGMLLKLRLEAHREALTAATAGRLHSNFS